MGSAKEVNRDDNTLLVASFADLNALEQSSPLGRLLGQQCSSEIVAKGYQVTELLLAESIYIDPQQGELLLSRDLEQIAAQHDADVVVVGTYTASAETVYVTAKVVRSNDARVLAANNFEIPVNREVISLLGR
jgi:TolB-like protein